MLYKQNHVFVAKVWLNCSDFVIIGMWVECFLRINGLIYTVEKMQRGNIIKK